jgi:hypothetical protein
MFQDPRNPGGGGFFGIDPFNFGGNNGLSGGGLLGGGIDPRKLGLLSGFAALAQAGAPSTTPKSFAGALGQGIQGGLQGYGMGQQFQQMGEQNALRRAQLGAQMEDAKLKRDRQDTLQRILSGGGPAPMPQPSVEKSLGGPVGLNPVGLQPQPQARPLEAPAPAGTSQQDQLRQKAQQLIGAGFLAEGHQMLQSAKDLEDKAPTTRTVREGKEQVTQEYVGGQWREVGRGPAFTDTPLVKIGEEKEFNKALGKETGEMYAGLLKADMNSPGVISKYQRLGQLLSNVNTGKFRGTTLELKAAAKSMGFDLNAMGIADDVAPAQAARALSNLLALENRNPSGGAGMPGALSDKDREFLVQTIPGLENDPAAIGTMIDYRVRLERRSQEVARKAREYRRKNGKFDDGFFDELQEWSNKTPLFAEVDKPAAPAKPTPGVVDFGSLR